MKLPIRELARKIGDVNMASVTTAQVTGEPVWDDDGDLDIPFDRDLTQTELDALVLLLTSPDDSLAAARKASATYLALPTPTTAQNTAQIKVLTRLALAAFERRA